MQNKREEEKDLRRRTNEMGTVSEEKKRRINNKLSMLCVPCLRTLSPSLYLSLKLRCCDAHTRFEIPSTE